MKEQVKFVTDDEKAKEIVQIVLDKVETFKRIGRPGDKLTITIEVISTK